MITALHEHFYRGIAGKYNQYDIKLKIAAEEDQILTSPIPNCPLMAISHLCFE